MTRKGPEPDGVTSDPDARMPAPIERAFAAHGSTRRGAAGEEPVSAFPVMGGSDDLVGDEGARADGGANSESGRPPTVETVDANYWFFGARTAGLGLPRGPLEIVFKRLSLGALDLRPKLAKLRLELIESTSRRSLSEAEDLRRALGRELNALGQLLPAGG